MTDLNQETIEKLTKICRIRTTPEEQLSLLQDLKNILTYIEQLNELETTNTTPCYQVIADRNNVTRDDIVGPTLSRKEFLENAPEQIGGMIRVPPVIKSSS